MRVAALLILTTIVVAVFLGAQHTPAPVPVATETYGDKVKRACAIESKTPAAQKDCYDRHILEKAFGDFSNRNREAVERALR